MPFIEIEHTDGALTGVDRAALADALAAAASDAEGTDLERARPVTWVTYDAPEGFYCSADPAAAVRATVAEGLLDDDGRQTLVGEITAELTDAIDGLEALATWVVIEETPDGNWGAGGEVVSSSQIAALTGGALADEG